MSKLSKARYDIAFDAAKHGVCMHAAAADRAAGQDQRGLLASDLTPYLRRLGNK